MFLELVFLGRYSLDIAARALFRGSQDRGQRLHLLSGDNRFANLPILFVFQGHVGIENSRLRCLDLFILTRSSSQLLLKFPQLLNKIMLIALEPDITILDISI